MGDKHCVGPIVMSIRVAFDEAGGGEVWFAGAGVYFSER